MTKAEFINRMQKNTGDADNQWSKKDCEFAMSTMLQTIMEVVCEGAKLSFVGFGSFEIVNVAEKSGVNPNTGERITIPAAKRPKFRAGKGFKDAVKGL